MDVHFAQVLGTLCLRCGLRSITRPKILHSRLCTQLYAEGVELSKNLPDCC